MRKKVFLIKLNNGQSVQQSRPLKPATASRAFRGSFNLRFHYPFDEEETRHFIDPAVNLLYSHSFFIAGPASVHILTASVMARSSSHHRLVCILFASTIVACIVVPQLASASSDLVSCEDVYRGSAHKLPCLCSRDTGEGSAINCDHVSFFGEFPALPFRQNIVSYSQRHAGIQTLEPQLFTASNIPLQQVDFSHNLLRRLMERLLDGVEGTLLELRLGHNKLGDQLNPIFSTNEFLHLKSLRVLDLSHNELRAFDNNIFRGLRNLTVSVAKHNASEAVRRKRSRAGARVRMFISARQRN